MNLQSVKDRVLTDPSFRSDAEQLLGVDAVNELLAAKQVVDMKSILEKMVTLVTTADTWEADQPLDVPQEFWAILYAFALQNLNYNPMENPEEFDASYGLTVASAKGLLSQVQDNTEATKLVKQFTNHFRTARKKSASKKTDKKSPISNDDFPFGENSDNLVDENF